MPNPSSKDCSDEPASNDALWLHQGAIPELMMGTGVGNQPAASRGTTAAAAVGHGAAPPVLGKHRGRC
jgi:hypothetical protein